MDNNFMLLILNLYPSSDLSPCRMRLNFLNHILALTRTKLEYPDYDYDYDYD